MYRWNDRIAVKLCGKCFTMKQMSKDTQVMIENAGQKKEVASQSQLSFDVHSDTKDGNSNNEIQES